MRRGGFLPLAGLLLTLAIPACQRVGHRPPPEASAPSAVTGAGPPATRVADVVDVFHGVEVHDPYRWLEDLAAPEVQAWMRAQDRYARRYLDALPSLPAVEARFQRIFDADQASFFDVKVRGGSVFALAYLPGHEAASLVAAPAVRLLDQGTFDVLLDLDRWDPEGLTSIDHYVPSFDGRLVALILSKAGTEAGALHLIDRTTGAEIESSIEGVSGGTAGGYVEWSPSGRSIYYTRYPRPGERPEEDLPFYVTIYRHDLGRPEGEDEQVFGEGMPKVAEYQLDMNPATGRLLVTVQDGDSGRFAHYLRLEGGTWEQLSRFSDGIVQVAFAPEGTALFGLSRERSPRGEIVRWSVDATGAGPPQVVVAADPVAALVESFWYPPTILPTASRLFVVYQVGGPTELRVFDRQGRRLEAPRLPRVATIDGLRSLGGDDVLFRVRSYTEPSSWYRYRSGAGRIDKTRISSTPVESFEGVVVRREEARSADGTMIPVNIILGPRARRDGSQGCVVTAYGAYGVSTTPRFRNSRRIILDAGLCWAEVNVRGGGEFGAEWHEQGRLTRKQTSVDDLLAALDHLVDRGYAAPGRLALIGASAGGLLVAAAGLQQPQKLAALVAMAGMYDMVRTELAPNGVFNIGEFGTVKDPDQFRALLALSPYHRVRDGVDYPPTLLMTGANDPRNPAYEANKLAARLQAAARHPEEILLRVA